MGHCLQQVLFLRPTTNSGPAEGGAALQGCTARGAPPPPTAHSSVPADNVCGGSAISHHRRCQHSTAAAPPSRAAFFAPSPTPFPSARYVVHHRTEFFSEFVLFCLICLGFFETPWWCIDNKDCASTHYPTVNATADAFHLCRAHVPAGLCPSSHHQHTPAQSRPAARSSFPASTSSLPLEAL